jgi:hypothetical protein
LSWSVGLDFGVNTWTYKIYRSSNGVDFDKVKEVPGKLVTASYTDGGLENGHKYWYYVTACNWEYCALCSVIYEGGWIIGPHNILHESMPSEIVTVTPYAPASAPNDFAVTLEVATGEHAARVHLSWSEPSDNGGLPVWQYRIWRSTNPGEEAALASVNAAPTEYYDYDFPAGSTCYYQMNAVTDVGNGICTDEIGIQIPDTPSAPRDVTATAMTIGAGVVVEWQSSLSNGGSSITKYVVYRRGMPYGTWHEVGVWGNPNIRPIGPYYFLDNGEDIGGLEYFHIYNYKVAAWNGVGCGDFGYAICTPHGAPMSPPGVWMFPTPPCAPTMLTPAVFEQNINVSWRAPADYGGEPITVWRLDRGTTPGVWDWENDLEFWFPDETQEPADHIYRVQFDEWAHLSPGKTYYFRVSAYNGVPDGYGGLKYGGWGLWSSTKSATTQPVVPTAPSDLKAASGVDKVLLTWEPSSYNGGAEITSYRVYRWEGGGTATLLTEIAMPNDLVYCDYEVAPGTTYHYCVKAKNVRGESPQSNEVTGGVLSLSDLMPQLEVQVDTASMYFPGEIVTFSALFSYQGTPVNPASSSAMLYGFGDAPMELTAAMIDTGLYEFSTTLPSDPGTGSWTLLVKGTYDPGTGVRQGASMKCLPTGAYIEQFNAWLQSIDDGVASVALDIAGAKDVIMLKLADLDAHVTSVQNGVIATIQTKVGEIQTHLSNIDATLVDVQGRIAHVHTDLGDLDWDVRWINATIMRTIGKGIKITVQTTVGTIDVDRDQVDMGYIPWAVEPKKGVDPAIYVGMAVLAMSLFAAGALTRGPARCVGHTDVGKRKSRKLSMPCKFR